MQLTPHESYRQSDLAYKVICGHRYQSLRDAALAKKAEPLVCRLESGKNYFCPADFKHLVEYLTPACGVLTALERGHFSVGAIKVVRLRRRGDAK